MINITQSAGYGRTDSPKRCAVIPLGFPRRTCSHVLVTFALIVDAGAILWALVLGLANCSVYNINLEDLRHHMDTAL